MASSKVQIQSARGGKSARFTLGREAFGKISAVEGISASTDLSQDLRRLEKVAPAIRRGALAQKYGKK